VIVEEVLMVVGVPPWVHVPCPACQSTRSHPGLVGLPSWGVDGLKQSFLFVPCNGLTSMTSSLPAPPALRCRISPGG
jgi:hypothetical protein